MKKVYLFAAAALTLASCSSDLNLSQTLGGEKSGNGEITFASASPNMTRANSTGAEAAKKLNNNFIVYGFKYATDEATTGTTDVMVFNNYNVNYTDGTDNTTESNTSGWEYVGLANHDGSINPQTIKYWDYNTAGYVFSAVSGTGITATKTTTGTTVYDKGWTVSIPAGGSLSDLYASKRHPQLKADYNKEVTLEFYNLATKVRFAVYETVPGYSVKIDNFYYTENGTETEAANNFAIDGKFKTLNKTAATELTVTYYDATDASIENRPKVTYTDGNVTASTYGFFGDQIQAATEVGTTSNTATYDLAEKEYTSILPYESSTETVDANKVNELSLKVDYTLTSTDGSGETIKVKGATAKVPTIYTQWKPNFAYTYIFKISDNTNGSTGTPGTDLAGLYPITFDAEVSSVDDGIQETITSVADPSITTYQKGVIVTKNNEYVAGDIYYTNDAKNVSAYEVYEVNNAGTIEKFITEEVVANWQNNFITLTKVTSTDVTAIPLSDGTNITTATNQAKKFTAETGKTYVIASKDITASDCKFKVVRVDGSYTPTYTDALTYSAGSAITATDGTATYTLKNGTVGVLGAKPSIKITNAGGEDVTANFTITPGANAGDYTIKLTDAAVKAGANTGTTASTYTVKYNNGNAQTFDVNLSYTLTAASVTVAAGNATGATSTLKIGSTELAGATIVNNNAGITITDNADGTYIVNAASNVADGAYTATIAGQTLTINVDSYAFGAANYLLIYPADGTAPTKDLTLSKNGTAQKAIDLTAATGYAAGVATIAADGTADKYIITAVAGGEYTLTYENASTTITVEKYALTPATAATIASQTGSQTISLTKNGTAVKLDPAKVKVYKDGAEVKTGYTLAADGNNLVFKNVTVKGDYTFEYTTGGVKAAETATVTVN